MFKYVKYTEARNKFTKLTFVQKNEDVKVITFDKPIVALESDDESVIDDLIAYQDEAINCQVISYDEFKALVETTLQYARVLQVVAEKFEENMDVVKKKYPLSERETWATQKEEAEKWMASRDDKDAPFLKILAEAESSTVESFAVAVLQKNQLFLSLSARYVAEKRLHKTELMKEIGIV